MNIEDAEVLPLGRSKQPAVFRPSRKIRAVLKNGEIRSTNVDLVFRELIRAKGARLDSSATKQVIVSGGSWTGMDICVVPIESLPVGSNGI